MTKAAKLSPSRRLLLVIGAALGLVMLSGASMLLLWGAASSARFVEYRMPGPHDGPMAIAAAADGTVWFTIDQADAIGRVRGGRIELLPTPGRNYELLGLAVAADGSAWYRYQGRRGYARQPLRRGGAICARQRDCAARTGGDRPRRLRMVR